MTTPLHLIFAAGIIPLTMSDPWSTTFDAEPAGERGPLLAGLAAAVVLGLAVRMAARRRRFDAGAAWLLLMVTWACLGICALWLGGSRPYWDM